jgi:hypothetical protein
VDARRTRLAGGAATLLSSHAGTSPTGDERHSESQSGPTADSLKASQLAAGRTLPTRPDVTAPIQTANLNGALSSAVGLAPAPDEREEHAERVSARPLASLVAVVDAGSGGALECRPKQQLFRARDMPAMASAACNSASVGGPGWSGSGSIRKSR